MIQERVLFVVLFDDVHVWSIPFKHSFDKTSLIISHDDYQKKTNNNSSIIFSLFTCFRLSYNTAFLQTPEL